MRDYEPNQGVAMLSSTLYCDTCGAANRPEAKFCFSCGEPLHAGTATGQTPAAGADTTASSGIGNLPMQGTLLRQRYRIVSQVGQGGFGAVYKAWLPGGLFAASASADNTVQVWQAM